MEQNKIFQNKKDDVFSFILKGKEYELFFEGISPRVSLNGTKQKAKTILRELIKMEKIPIELHVKDKKGNIKELTTNEIGTKLLIFIGIKKDSKKSIKNLENKSASTESIEKKITKKLKADYNRRVNNNINGFESFDEFSTWYSGLKKECFYCGLDEETLRFIVMNGLLKSKRFPENGVLKRGKARGYYLEVDRKNPEKYYSTDNCVLACYFCNNDKSDVFNSKEYIDFYQDRKNYLEELVKKYRKNE